MKTHEKKNMNENTKQQNMKKNIKQQKNIKKT